MRIPKQNAYDEIQAVAMKHSGTPQDGLLVAAYLIRTAVGLSRASLIRKPDAARDFIVHCVNGAIEDVEEAVKGFKPK